MTCDRDGRYALDLNGGITTSTTPASVTAAAISIDDVITSWPIDAPSSSATIGFTYA